MSKCKYYLRKAPEMDVSSCGVEVDYEWDTYCTYCGGKIKETKEPVPRVVLELLEEFYGMD